MIAAEELGCTPWELEQQPIYWRQRALIKRTATNNARVQREDMERQMKEMREMMG